MINYVMGIALAVTLSLTGWTLLTVTTLQTKVGQIETNHIATTLRLDQKINLTDKAVQVSLVSIDQRLIEISTLLRENLQPRRND